MCQIVDREKAPRPLHKGTSDGRVDEAVKSGPRLHRFANRRFYLQRNTDRSCSGEPVTRRTLKSMRVRPMLDLRSLHTCNTLAMHQ
jgi:hypothetical protein